MVYMYHADVVKSQIHCMPSSTRPTLTFVVSYAPDTLSLKIICSSLVVDQELAMPRSETEDMSDEENDEEEGNDDEERLYYAITGEDIVTLRHMLEDGLNPNSKFHGSNQLDKSALHLCCETGNYEGAKVRTIMPKNVKSIRL